MKSLPLPRDVEDPAIAAFSCPYIRDVDRSSIGAQWGEGTGWRFSGPASSGSPVAGSASRSHPLPPTRCFGRATDRDVDWSSGGGYGGAKTARNGAEGAAADSPLLHAPSSDPTLITLCVEELTTPTPFLSFP